MTMWVTLFIRHPNGYLEPTKYSVGVTPEWRDGALRISATFSDIPAGVHDLVAGVYGPHGAHWQFGFGKRSLTEGDMFTVDASFGLVPE